MATQLQIRRGTTSQMNAFTGAEGELAVNTTTDTVHVHDGSTAGGFALAKADGSNIATYAGSFTTLAASGASTLTGAVGINIAPTSYKLTVNSGATTETTAAAIGYNGDAGTNLYINTDHGNNLVSLYASGSASKTMRFLSGSLEVMRLATTGDVGINNSNPSAFNSLGGKTLAVGNGTTTSTLTLFSDDTADGNGYGHVAFADSDTSSSTAQYAGLLQYFHGDNSMRFYTASTERLRIFSDGDVSIGMAANYAKLNVNGDVRAENSKFLAGREDAANPAFAFHDDSDTGIFNINPNILGFSAAGTERMRITSAGAVELTGPGGAGETFLNFTADSNTTKAQISAAKAGASGGRLIFSTNNSSGTLTESMRIDSAGRVTTPYQPAFQAVAVTQNNIPIGANTTVNFSAQVFDQGSNYAGTSFTAPVTGRYQLNAIIYAQSVDSAADYVQIALVTSNRQYYSIFSTTSLDQDAAYMTFPISVLVDMDASDTAYVEVQLNNTGSAQMDINANSHFSGYLVA